MALSEQEELELLRLRKRRSQVTPPELAPMKMDPTEGMSTYEKVAAGAGKALTDLGRGAGQLVGAVSREDVDESRRLDAPLMKTGAGQAGAIGGSLIPLSALALVPGANTIAGSAALGAATGAIEPVGTGDSRMQNTALGGAVGGGAAAGLKLAGAGVSKLMTNSKNELAGLASRNSVRDTTLAAAQKEGYVIPGSSVGEGSKTLESIGGKAATGQEAAIRNQEVTNKIARREAGLAEDASITEKSLADARTKLAAPYREVEQLASNHPLSQPPFKSPKETLQELREVRSDAQAEWKFYGRNGDPKTLKEAQRLDKQADLLEDQIEKVASALGKPDLVDRLKAARVALAKNFDVEKAVNLGNGNVDAHVIGRILEKRGEQGVTGGLQTIGKFAESFGKYSREAGGVPAPGVSKLAPYGSIALGALGGGASEHFTGTPYGAAAAALPLLSGPARSLALSRLMQPRLSYNPGMALRLSDLATNNQTGRAILPSALAGAANGQQ